jgi:F0F1-type ATP synthase epsilon subunit
MSTITLKIVTPEGIDRTFACDSVVLWMAPDSNGHGEGSVGIRKDHAEAVIAVGNGPMKAFLEGKMVFSAETQGGFATVLENIVTVVTPHIVFS